MVVDTAIYPEFTQVDISGKWYVTGQSGDYLGKSAVIFQIQQAGNLLIMTTDSASPVFDFSTPDIKYSLLVQDSPSVVFDTTENKSGNYVTLTCKNESNISSPIIEYQIKIMS